jgi:DNA-binding NarL/FixJ family response regulator
VSEKEGEQTGERSGPVRLLIVDDHEMFAQGIRMVLDADGDLEVVGTTGDAANAYRMARERHADVVLMDVDLPGLDGIEATRGLSELGSVQVIVVSASLDARTVAAAFNAGAAGYVPKTRAADQLIDTIHRAADGDLTIPQEYVGSVLSILRSERDAKDERDRLVEGLTNREREVLELLCGGESVADIAESLHVSVFTVRGHVRSLLRKLDAGSIAQAVAFAYRTGIVDIP